MKSASHLRELASNIIALFGVLFCVHNAVAAPAETPLAKASDIEFTVEYSTEKLMLGDILFAQVTLKNKTDHTVRVSSFRPLVIRAKTPKATQLAWGFGEYPSGTTRLELASGQRIVFEVALDVFSDDNYEDGTFDPFDSKLEGQKLTLHATCSTLIPRRSEGLDYRDFLLEHTHVIEFGPPLISRQEFDDAVTEVLKNDDHDPLSFGLRTRQLSYLFTQTNNLTGYAGSPPRTYAAIITVLSERLPKESSARRAASLILAFDSLLNTESSPTGGETRLKIVRLYARCSLAEKSYWESELLRALNTERMLNREVDVLRKAMYLSKSIREFRGDLYGVRP